jgi:hypothetical protein
LISQEITYFSYLQRNFLYLEVLIVAKCYMKIELIILNIKDMISNSLHLTTPDLD